MKLRDWTIYFESGSRVAIERGCGCIGEFRDGKLTGGSSCGDGDGGGCVEDMTFPEMKLRARGAFARLMDARRASVRA